MRKFEDGRDLDWDDLRQLVNRAVVIDRERSLLTCVRGFGFLAELTPDERGLANDAHQRDKHYGAGYARSFPVADGSGQLMAMWIISAGARGVTTPSISSVLAWLLWEGRLNALP